SSFCGEVEVARTAGCGCINTQKNWRTSYHDHAFFHLNGREIKAKARLQEK
ncbi:unnamed protein product, partial [Amoebophrya sp. A120]